MPRREEHWARAWWGPGGIGKVRLTDLFSVSLYLPVFISSRIPIVCLLVCSKTPMAAWYNRKLMDRIQSHRPESGSVTLD